MDKRSFITVAVGNNVIHVATNRSKAFAWLQDALLRKGLIMDDCKVRVSNLELTSRPRNCYYGAFRDLLNLANPDTYEGVDLLHDDEVIYRFQRHLANGGERA